MASFKDIINSEKPVVVDFFAEWCSPCKMMTPILEQVKKSLGDQVTIIKIDVDKNQKLAIKHNVRGVPTLKVYQHGVERWSGSGLIQADKLVNVIHSTTT
ncbi:MAG: thioredoxin [Bacteroidales bacterium]|nr:thioredoxin [Bacteroidales bacterium]